MKICRLQPSPPVRSGARLRHPLPPLLHLKTPPCRVANKKTRHHPHDSRLYAFIRLSAGSDHLVEVEVDRMQCQYKGASIANRALIGNGGVRAFAFLKHIPLSLSLSDVTARPLCAMGSPEPASMVRSVLSRYICEHVPSLYTSRAAAAREPIRT
jgi:hypothetical protein